MAADLAKCQEEKNKLLAEAGEEVLMEAVPPVVPGSKFILVNKNRVFTYFCVYTQLSIVTLING